MVSEACIHALLEIRDGNKNFAQSALVYLAGKKVGKGRYLRCGTYEVLRFLVHVRSAYLRCTVLRTRIMKCTDHLAAGPLGQSGRPMAAAHAFQNGAPWAWPWPVFLLFCAPSSSFPPFSYFALAIAPDQGIHALSLSTQVLGGRRLSLATKPVDSSPSHSRFYSTFVPFSPFYLVITLFNLSVSRPGYHHASTLDVLTVAVHQASQLPNRTGASI